MKAPTFPIDNSKGGTGKSSVAGALAKYLAQFYRVAYIDADFTSSNSNEVMKISHKPAEFDKKRTGWRVQPREISKNLFGAGITQLQENSTTGVQLDGVYQSSTLRMIYEDMDWKDIQVAIIDMPAGTDDLFNAMETIFKKNLKGIFIVTQPKTIIDVKRVVELCGVHGYPIKGLIENMNKSHMACCNKPAVCPDCGKIFNPFKCEGSAENIAKFFGIPFLGSIPLTDGVFEEVAKPVIAKMYLSIRDELEEPK